METDSKLILIVDDHADIRQLIRLTLGKQYRLMEAETGDQALEMACEVRPDLVILDVMMPGSIDGIGVLDAIRRNPECAHTKVVMVTARGQSHDYQLGMEHGADAYFIKPFSPLQLSSAVKAMLANTPPSSLTTPDRGAGDY